VLVYYVVPMYPKLALIYPWICFFQYSTHSNIPYKINLVPHIWAACKGLF
jgi:hypothetical protein